MSMRFPPRAYRPDAADVPETDESPRIAVAPHGDYVRLTIVVPQVARVVLDVCPDAMRDLCGRGLRAADHAEGGHVYELAEADGAA